MLLNQIHGVLHTKLFEQKDKMNDPASLISEIEAVFLDEAQDLSPAQWDMFFYIEKHCIFILG